VSVDPCAPADVSPSIHVLALPEHAPNSSCASVTRPCDCHELSVVLDRAPP